VLASRLDLAFGDGHDASFTFSPTSFFVYDDRPTAHEAAAGGNGRWVGEREKRLSESTPATGVVPWVPSVLGNKEMHMLAI